MVAVEHVLDLENAGNFDPIFEEKIFRFFFTLVGLPSYRETQVYCELLARVPVTTALLQLFEYLTPTGKAL